MSFPEAAGSARFLLPACVLLWLSWGTARAAVAGIELAQADGTLLTIEAPAERIVTLSPHLAELAFAAGIGDRLLATVEYSNFPVAADTLPRIGDAFRFDLERILALKPDLVMAWDSGNPATALARLEDLGLTVWRIELLHPDDIPSTLVAMAKSAGMGEPKSARMARDRLSRLRRDFSDRPAWTYFYQVSGKPLFTLNGRHLVSQGLAICGGRNVFADEPVIAPQVSREAVLQADPDALIAPVLSARDNPLEHWLAWPGMSAVRHQRMILLPADEISRATPRTLDALARACERMDQLRDENDEDISP